MEPSSTPFYEGEDHTVMLRALTMAFIILLSKQPNMMFDVTKMTFQSFPFADYQLRAHTDPLTGDSCFMLTASHECPN